MYTLSKTPSTNLTKFIDAYWIVENQTKKSLKIPIVPDGCIDIVSKNGKLLLVGIMDIARLVDIEPNDRYIGIRFKAGVIGTLLNADVSKFNNKLTPLDNINKTLHNRVHQILSKYPTDFRKLDKLFESLMYNLSFDTRILSTIKDIELTGGNITLDALCSKSKLSSKQLERLFIIHVGLTPKKFTRIVRFFHIHRKLSYEGIANLCYKVLQHGYYDQAHFNREYKLLTGLTPTSEIMSIFYNTKD